MLFLLAALCLIINPTQAGWFSRRSTSYHQGPADPLPIQTLPVTIHDCGNKNFNLAPDMNAIANTLVGHTELEPDQAREIALWASAAKHYEHRSFDFKYEASDYTMAAINVIATRLPNNNVSLRASQCRATMQNVSPTRTDSQRHCRRSLFRRKRCRTSYVKKPRGLTAAESHAIMSRLESIMDAKLRELSVAALVIDRPEQFHFGPAGKTVDGAEVEMDVEEPEDGSVHVTPEMLIPEILKKFPDMHEAQARKLALWAKEAKEGAEKTVRFWVANGQDAVSAFHAKLKIDGGLDKHVQVDVLRAKAKAKLGEIFRKRKFLTKNESDSVFNRLVLNAEKKLAGKIPLKNEN